MPVLRLGTRGSRLALTQTRSVARALSSALPELETEVIIIQTTGDKILDSPLSVIGGKGVFTKEIEEALLDGRIDIAVHSLKDLPTQQPPGLAVGAITERENPADLLVAAEPVDLETPGIRIGTSSLRRRAQLLRRYPGLELVEIRGNVPTRIQKMRDGHCDAVILAAAGMARLAEHAPYIHQIGPEVMLPAPGQGALGIQIRDGDESTAQFIARLHHEASAACCVAERTVLHALGGGCQLPLGCLAIIDGDELWLRARVISLDGSATAEGDIRGVAEEAEKIGKKLAQQLLANGAAEILRALPAIQDSEITHPTPPSPLAGKRILVTRDEDADGPLSRALRDLGADPICMPLISHRPPDDPTPLRDALSRIDTFAWMVLTSRRAVETLIREKHDIAATAARIACVGEATARALREAGGKPALAPEEGTAEALITELTRHVHPGERILYPRSNRADGRIVDALSRAGCVVEDPIAYETGPSPHAEAARNYLEKHRVDAAVFCSPTAVEAAGEGGILPMLKDARIGSMGPRTSAALCAFGIEADCEPDHRTFHGLAAALAELFRNA